MPSFSDYKKFTQGTVGEMRKRDSELIMEATWYGDIATRTCYFYDWYHDVHQTQLNNLHPVDDPYKIPMDVKYINRGSQSYEKDPINYHIQLKPSQKCVVPYYEEYFEKRYNAVYPVGLYIDIPDVNGIYNRWLIVAVANGNHSQFPTYEILRCDYIVQYVYDNKKYNIAGVLRSQNSYNSGIWVDRYIQITQDQQQFVVPLNRDTEHIYYNQRMIIDNKVLTEPRAWLVSKINRIGHNGLALITLSQNQYNAQTDYIELDENGEVTGMWADYFKSGITPTDPSTEETDIRGEIAFSGIKPELKVGGSYKKFTVNFFENDEIIPLPLHEWKVSLDDVQNDELFNIVHSSELEENQIKVKFLGDETYIGKVATVSYGNAKLEVAIVSL